MEASEVADNLVTSAHGVIDDLMHHLGINQAQLAEKMGVSPSHVSRLLSVERDLKLSTLDRIFLAMDALVGLTVVYNIDEGEVLEADRVAVEG